MTVGPDVSLTVGDLSITFDERHFFGRGVVRSPVPETQTQVDYTLVGTPKLTGDAFEVKYRWTFDLLLLETEWGEFKALVFEHFRRLRTDQGADAFVVLYDRRKPFIEALPATRSGGEQLPTEVATAAKYYARFQVVLQLPEEAIRPVRDLSGTGIAGYKVSFSAHECARIEPTSGLYLDSSETAAYRSDIGAFDLYALLPGDTYPTFVQRYIAGTDFALGGIIDYTTVGVAYPGPVVFYWLLVVFGYSDQLYALSLPLTANDPVGSVVVVKAKQTYFGDYPYYNTYYDNTEGLAFDSTAVSVTHLAAAPTPLPPPPKIYASPEQTFTGQTGEFFLSSYGPNENRGFLIQPSAGAASISVTITNLYLEPGYDFLSVYDGLNLQGAPLAEDLTGQISVRTVEASSGSVYLLFSSDGDVEFDGFAFSYQVVG